MPSLATGPRATDGPRRTRALGSRCRARGFTLIEILVVVILIGILAGLAVISMPTTATVDRQSTEARRLLARMELAREEAVLQARPVGLRADDDGYLFVHFRDRAWLGFAERHPLGEHELPADVRLELRIDDEQIALRAGEDGDADGEDDAAGRPQIFFLPGGEVMPGYTLYIHGEGSRREFRIAAGDEQWLELTEEEF